MSRIAELAHAQREARGMVEHPFLGKKGPKVPGPYVQNPENEARAALIVHLRRQEARNHR